MARQAVARNGAIAAHGLVLLSRGTEYLDQSEMRARRSGAHRRMGLFRRQFVNPGPPPGQGVATARGDGDDGDDGVGGKF